MRKQTSPRPPHPLAPLIYEGGCPSAAQDRGEYAVPGRFYRNLSANSVGDRKGRPYADGSPRPSGTPLINAGGKGLVLIFGVFVIASAYQEILALRSE